MKLFRFKKPAEEQPVVGEIVIIDDTPENLHLLNDILSERGYKVRALPNGEMGLSACRASPPDLVLLDITMPGMDGYEVAEKLKADASTRDIPIIFISAMSQTEDKVRAFKAGGVDYVTKPLQVEEVMARVETHLSISRMREQISQANEKLLAWAVELSQPAASAGTASDFSLPEGLASLFGKPSASIQSGDRCEATVSIVAVAAPSDDTLARIEDGLVTQHQGGVIARFSNVLIAVSPSENETIASWLEEGFAAEDLTVSLGSGSGILQIVPSNSDLRLDFKSSSVTETLTALLQS
jgi:DNA-binding response OmpR family regulator